MVERTTFDVPEAHREAREDGVATGATGIGTDAGTGTGTGTDDPPTLTTGTTTVAVAADDAVVLAADRRASLGGRFTANKRMRKVARVHPTAALAMSGSVGPVQDLVDALDAEAELYAARRGDPMSMTALSTVAGNLVRGVPAQLLLGGVDDAGAHVYELDGGGSVMPTDYAAAGSGMQVAYGVLEGRAETVAGVDAARELALDAVAAASERDTASGNGAHVATVTSEGVAVEPGETVEGEGGVGR